MAQLTAYSINARYLFAMTNGRNHIGTISEMNDTEIIVKDGVYEVRSSDIQLLAANTKESRNFQPKVGKLILGRVAISSALYLE